MRSPLNTRSKARSFPISHVCYAEFPKYERMFEVDKSLQIPIVNVSNMKLFKSLLKAILDSKDEESATTKP